MAYIPYASLEDYASILPDEEPVTVTELKKASRHIDSLTFNRIVETGFEALSDFQKDIIREAVCRQALFEHDNADMIESVLSSYSINGVSMQFGDSWNVVVQNGVAMQRDLYSLLAQTGLCCRVIV